MVLKCGGTNERHKTAREQERRRSFGPPWLNSSWRRATSMSTGGHDGFRATGAGQGVRVGAPIHGCLVRLMVL